MKHHRQMYVMKGDLPATTGAGRNDISSIQARADLYLSHSMSLEPPSHTTWETGDCCCHPVSISSSIPPLPAWNKWWWCTFTPNQHLQEAWREFLLHSCPRPDPSCLTYRPAIKTQTLSLRGHIKPFLPLYLHLAAAAMRGGEQPVQCMPYTPATCFLPQSVSFGGRMCSFYEAGKALPLPFLSGTPELGRHARSGEAAADFWNCILETGTEKLV